MARLKRILIRCAVGCGGLILLADTGLAIALQFLPTRSYRPFVSATRIEVRGLRGGPTTHINDPARVHAITEFVNRFPDGWGGSSGLLGVPVPALAADFYKKDEFLGHFGVGPDFFETQRDGSFDSRRANDADIRTFRQLVGAPE